MSIINKVIGGLLTLFILYLVLAQGNNVNQILQGLGTFNQRTLNALRS